MSDVVGYDYIIVGAGSAGCVLANRLSADAGATVLLLEAGGHDRHPYIQIPIGLGKLQQYRMFDWGYTTEAEPHLNGRQLRLLRGKVLGGSSSINVMAYQRLALSRRCGEPISHPSQMVRCNKSDGRPAMAGSA